MTTNRRARLIRLADRFPSPAPSGCSEAGSAWCRRFAVARVVAGEQPAVVPLEDAAAGYCARCGRPTFTRSLTLVRWPE